MEKGVESCKGGGVGEVRRINVLYLLSRGGRTDHPHLFRVSHLHHAGVLLRDVKRWLSELRGKDMPENFSWSYKRKYKAGYVWQDLMDDDLITPISDNEYVLKGCDVRGTPPCADAPKEKSSSLDDENKLNGQEEKAVCVQKQVEEVLRLQVTADSDESSPKPPPLQIDQDSPGGEGESARCKIPFKIDLSQDFQEQKQQQQQEVVKKAVTKAVVARASVEQEQVQGAPGSSKTHPVGRARRMRAAQVLRNILTCGAADADADDAALRPVLRQRAGAGDEWPRTPVCPGIDGCGLHVSRKVRLRRGGKDKAKRDGGKRDGGDAHKPASLPRCSQCGKEFKPRELHSHMQSCRGFRERMRSTASTRISVDRNRNSTARPEHGRSKVHYSPERPSSAFLLAES